MGERMKKPLTSLEEGAKLYDEIAEQLALGVRERAHPFHIVSLATVGLDGSPRVRKVVLRQYLREEHMIVVHSDRRSPKISEIRHENRVAVMCYDSASRMQLRIAGVATIHADDAVADARWISSQIASRRCYLTALAPSTPLEHARVFKHLTDPWTPEMDKEARRNFCTVCCHIHSIDFLELSAHGHRRMGFSWDENGRFFAQPLMP